jgi:hypothetical protein
MYYIMPEPGTMRRFWIRSKFLKAEGAKPRPHKLTLIKFKGILITFPSSLLLVGAERERERKQIIWAHTSALMPPYIDTYTYVAIEVEANEKSI